MGIVVVCARHALKITRTIIPHKSTSNRLNMNLFSKVRENNSSFCRDSMRLPLSKGSLTDLATKSETGTLNSVPQRGNLGFSRSTCCAEGKSWKAVGTEFQLVMMSFFEGNAAISNRAAASGYGEP